MTSMTSVTARNDSFPGFLIRLQARDGEAAREVFLADPDSPISAVAERAGVGISALYRRYRSKDELLQRLATDGLQRYVDEAQAAVAQKLVGNADVRCSLSVSDEGDLRGSPFDGQVNCLGGFERSLDGVVLLSVRTFACRDTTAD